MMVMMVPVLALARVGLLRRSRVFVIHRIGEL